MSLCLGGELIFSQLQRPGSPGPAGPSSGSPEGYDKQRGPCGGNCLLPPRNPASPFPRFEEAGRVAWSQRVALVTARVGSLALSNYSVKYWHITLSDCLSILNNMTVSSTVTIPARPLRPEKCRNELKVLLQRKGLVKIRPQNELSFCAKRTGR